MIWVQHWNSASRTGVFTPSAGLVMKVLPMLDSCLWSFIAKQLASVPVVPAAAPSFHLTQSVSEATVWDNEGLVGSCESKMLMRCDWTALTRICSLPSVTTDQLLRFSQIHDFFLYLFSSNRLRRSWTWLEQASKRPKRNRPRRAQVTPHQLNP